MNFIILLFLPVMTWSRVPTPPITDDPVNSEEAIGSYGLNTKEVTISGVSSGAFMASQMSVAYANSFKAIASVAGGIYWCAQGSADRSQKVCMAEPEQIDVSASVNKIRELATKKLIDNPKTLSRQKKFIFTSSVDKVILPINSNKIVDFYQKLGADKNLETSFDMNAAHGFPTLSYGAECQKGFLPWILNCNYDLAGEILQKAYGHLNPSVKIEEDHLLKFDQSEFSEGTDFFYKNGWVYVPKDCQSRKSNCRLHVALHGCQMNPDFIQDQFAVHSGFNEWAESNRLIILYPQANRITSINPFGCWDWFGYTGPEYMTKNGPQMKGVYQMIQRVSR